MRKLLFIMSLIGGLLSIPSTLLADDGQKKTIRLFLNSGDLLDFDAEDIDSITTTADSQTIWYADTCRTIAIEAIDSIWYMSPTLRLSTQGMNFGKVAVGNSKTLTAMLTNTGDQLERFMMFASGGFTVKNIAKELIIKQGESVDIEVSFNPTDSIAYTGTFSLYSSASHNGLMNLTLLGDGVSDVRQEANSIELPAEQTFDILIEEDDQLESFEGFKIVNFNGEYNLDIPAMGRSMQSIRRSGIQYNKWQTNAKVSSSNLQLHSFTDALGNPYLYTISLPNEKPEISFTQTAIALLMSTPYLAPSNATEYKNTAALLKQLKSFDGYVDKVRKEYNDAKKHNRTPDYSQLNAVPIFHELFEMIRDNRELTLGGISLKDLNVTPQSATFKLHNDFKRTVAVYASRIRMNEGNLVVVDQQEITPTISDIISKMLDHLYKLIDKDIKNEDALQKDEEDMFMLGTMEALVKELAEVHADDLGFNQEFPIWVPFMMESGSSNYWDIVCDARWDLYWGTFFDGMPEDGVKAYLESNEKSIFYKDSEEMTFDFKGYDKIQLDLYGIGKLENLNWKSLSDTDKFRILFMMLYGGYFDAVQPLWKFITGCEKEYKTVFDRDEYSYDLRYGATRLPEIALVSKLYLEFRKDPKNWRKFIELGEKEDYMGMFKYVGKFVLKEMTKLPEEAKMPYSEANRCTYINLLYFIIKKYTDKTFSSERFREFFLSFSSTLLGMANVALKTIEACEAAMDFGGSLWAYKNSELKQTFIINKFDKPFIYIKEPTMTYMTTDASVHFSWEASQGNNYGQKYAYGLEMAVETLSDVTQVVVLNNLSVTQCDYNIAQVPNAKSARRILFRIFAHQPGNPQQVYMVSDFIELMYNINAPQVATPEMVDLGLPSGTKWAVCNFGAKSAKDPGFFYAWGEVYSKATFSWKNYKYSGNTSNSLTKYCTKSSYGKVDNKTCLEADDDRVKIEYGYYWSIPTKEDWQELIDKCTWSRFGDDFMVRGPNGQVILLPAAGYQDGLNTYDAGKEGYYWATSVDEGSPDDAWFMHVKGAKPEFYSFYRYQGRSIRPVQHQPNYAAPDMSK